MLCSGEELDIITSGKEWAEMMGERLLIPAAAATTITTNTNNTTTACSSSGSGAINPNNNKNSNMVARVSDKPPPATDQALRCPRCDSSNTKFCYYNNYSLSQPRHFCKACKRYWTRGGTLRNVPVGGGCRKNKRVRKPSAAAATPRALPPPDPIASSAHLDAATIYALQTAAAPLPILTSSAFELPPPPNLGGLGLELQGLPPASSAAMSLFGDYPLYGSNLSSASLVMSGVKQAKQVEDYLTLLQFDELQASEISGIIKLEAQANSMNINSIDWQTVPHDNLLDNFGPAAAMYWNTGGGSGIWPDGVNCGSSVSPLI